MMYNDIYPTYNQYDNVFFINKTLFILILIIVALLIAYSFYSHNKQIENLKNIIYRDNIYDDDYPIDKNGKTDNNDKINNNVNFRAENPENSNISITKNQIPYMSQISSPFSTIPPLMPPISSLPIPEDPVKVYDIQSLTDPLSPPTSRPPSYAISPMLGNPLFNYPTRGLPDDYSYLGNLVESSVLNISEENLKENKSQNQNTTSLLQLMGRQKYPSTCKYEYYALIPRGEANFIKVHIRSPKGEELFDGDEVVIPELGHKKYIFRKNRSIWKEYYG